MPPSAYSRGHLLRLADRYLRHTQSDPTRSSVATWLSVGLGALATSSGCSIPAVVKRPQPTDCGKCDVWMDIAYEDGDEQIYAVDSCNTTARKVCIKRQGKPVRIPEEI